MKKRKRFFKVFLFFLFLCTFSFIGLYVYARFSPKLSIKGANGYFLYNDSGESLMDNAKDWVSIDDISDNLKKATVSAEDKNFYKHMGFDALRIMKALMINVKNRSNSQGASTITQQLSKNLFLNFDKTWSRKMKEALITIRLESHYSKDKILEGYLNTINYGGIFGIENAASYYFGKKAESLSLGEASILAGIPKNPSKYSPLINYNESKKRQKIILDSMVKNKFISRSEADSAYLENLNFKRDTDENRLKMVMYYQDAVLKELGEIDSIPSSFLETGGLKIYTNMNDRAQKILEDSFNKNVTNSEIEIAGALMEPTSGKILALTGGRDFDKSEFNRAISSKRQVGSTIKPFLYYAALENGFTPSTTFTSERTSFNFSGNKIYTPKNYNDKYADGPISLAAAISYSDNVYAVKTHLFLGDEALPDILKRVGISNNFSPLPSLALGAEEIDLMSMMGAYGALANEGYKTQPYLISKVTDMEGNVLYKHVDDNENILNKSTVYILNELLTTTYSKEFTSYNVPTCLSIFPKMTHKYAVKSGTTNTDNLIFGYNKNLVVGLWTGYDDNKNVDNSDSSNIKNMWVDIMENYLDGKNDDETWYKTPDNVVGVAVDPVSGKPSDDSSKAKILYYIKGTEPSDSKAQLDDIIPTVKVQDENSVG